MAEPPKTRTPLACTASLGPTLSVSSAASSTFRSRVLFAARTTRLLKGVHLLPRDLNVTQYRPMNILGQDGIRRSRMTSISYIRPLIVCDICKVT